MILDNFIHNNNNLAIEQLVDFIDVAGELLEFLSDLSLDELDLAAIDLTLADVGGQLLELLGKGDDLAAGEFDLTQLVLGAVVEQLLPPLSVSHYNIRCTIMKLY